MLSLTDIKKEYGLEFHKFGRGLLREYLQYQILGIIFSHPSGQKLSFLGGTALRIAYGISRFSEDLDFDNKGLSWLEFQELAEFTRQELAKRGYAVEIKIVSKQAFHCHIRFANLLFEQGLSPLTEEKVVVQLDTFDQGVDYVSQIFILDKFDLFKQILVTPKQVILAQKLWTITKRKRAKGRDYYDIMFLAPTTTPDPAFLKAKFGTTDWSTIKLKISEAISGLDFKELANDLAPFLVKAKDAERILLFPEYLDQIDWNIDTV